LRQAFHVDGDAVALLLARQRFQQVDRAIDVVVDGRLGGGVIQLLDLGDRIHRRPNLTDFASAPRETSSPAGY
jgi:hypothetical protein